MQGTVEEIHSEMLMCCLIMHGSGSVTFHIKTHLHVFKMYY